MAENEEKKQSTAGSVVGQTAGQIGRQIGKQAGARLAGSALGAALGSALPVIGTVVGAVVGQVLVKFIKYLAIAAVGVVAVIIIFVVVIAGAVLGLAGGRADIAFGSELLQISKTASPSQIDIGAPATTVTFTITVRNTSTDPNQSITGISVTDEELGVAYSVGDLAGGTSSSRSFTDTITDTSRDRVIENTARAQGQLDGKTTSAAATARVFIGEVPVGDPFGWPTSGSLTQPPLCCLSHKNLSAVDIGAVAGTKIYSTHAGLAFWGDSPLLDYDGDGFIKNSVSVDPEDAATCRRITPAFGCLGKYVVVVGQSYTSIYAHMLAINFGCVNRNASAPIKQGALIGFVDDTGYSLGNHLHYEIRNTAGGALTAAELTKVMPNWNVSSVTASYSGDDCG
jgi:uncharacterized repeat protein (TIGR01451 family)